VVYQHCQVRLSYRQLTIHLVQSTTPYELGVEKRKIKKGSALHAMPDHHHPLLLNGRV
jgi:hypothetical protein